MKRIIIWILSLLIIAQIAYAGVTNPLPTELNLLQGESGRFKFQIQTIASNQEIECISSLAGESPLIIEFDPAEIIVPAGTVREVRGTVTVPQNLEFGTYEEEFCISCSPTQGTAGAAVKIDTCDLPIKVNVVQERTRENMFIPPKPFPLIWKVIIISAVLIIIALIWLYLWERKHHIKKLVRKKKK